MTVLPRLNAGFIVGTLLATLAATPAAHAQASDAAAAQALFDQGKALMAAGKSAEACPKFAESQRLDPGVGTLLNLGACYEAAGQLASAWSTFRDAESAARAAGSAEGLQVSRDRAEALEPKLSKIVLTVAGETTPGLEVRRDGVLVGRAQWGLAIPADPGRHTVTASAPGRASWQTEINLTEPGSATEVAVPELPLAAATEPAPRMDAVKPPADEHAKSGGLSTQHYLAITAGGIGVVGVVVGSVFGLQSKSKHDEAAKHCDGGACRDTTGVSLLSDAREAGNLSTVGFIVGGVGLAGGAVLWLTADPKASEGTTALELGPGRLALRRTF